jgi:Spy/CpxP family protein refolding chaperone
MKKSIVLAIAIMFTAFPFIYADNSHTPDTDDGIGPGMAIGDIFKVMDELKLTPDQEEKLQAMRESSKRELFSMRNDLKTTVWDIQDEFKKDTVDKAKINSLTDKMADIEKKLIKTRTEHMFKVKEILTPEQFKKLINLLEKHKGKMQKKIMEK